MNKKVLYPIAVLVIGVGLAYVIATTEPAEEVIVFEPLPVLVRVMPVKAVSEFLNISSQGTVQPRSQTELIPEVSGRVTWISSALVGGGSFAAGDILLRIDDADYLTAVDRGRAAVERAEVEQDFASDDLKRTESLFAKKLASQSQLDSARRSARVASANLADFSAGIDQAERDLSRTELRAPFDGLVRKEQVDLGQFISRGQSIGTIYAVDYAEVRLPISPDQIVYLGVPLDIRGQIPAELRPKVTVSAEFGATRVIWEGELIRIESVIDERSRMIYGVSRLRKDPQNSLPMIPVGLFVQADIQGRKVNNVIRLPRSALRDRNQVLVVDKQDRLRFRSVSILRLEHDEVLISEGLKDGERVCISPMQTVVDGMLVQAQSQ